jgi:hypothetical protein
LDKQAILPGVPYPRKIRAWLRERCSVMVAVMGPDWLNAQDDNGNKLLFRPHDWVHDEIAEALALGLPVLPVLIYDTPLPAITALPRAIAGLIIREEIRIRHFDGYDDIQNLIHCIEALDPDLARGRQKVAPTDIPAWATGTSELIYRGAALVYSVAYKAEIGAPLIRLSQALGGTTTGAASVLYYIPDRKAAAILEAMDRRGALLIWRELDTHKRSRIMEYLPPDIRYQMSAEDYPAADDE